MRSFPIRLRARSNRPHLLIVASATVAASVGIVLTLTSTAQANNEPWYLHPAPSTQQLQAWSGNPHGQTSAPASYAFVVCTGSTAYVSVHLIRTNRRRLTFQSAYSLDTGPWIWTGDTFTTHRTGTGWGTFTVEHLSAGDHQVAIDINTVPGAGSTYYLNATRNFNRPGNIGIYFACPS
jgi:hypothetical protein